jgi:hypothetical protein
MFQIRNVAPALLLCALPMTMATMAGCTGKQIGGAVGAVAGAAALDDSPSAGAEIGSAVGKQVGRSAAKEKDEPVVNTASDRQEQEASAEQQR